jgi:hypothetical protein
LPNDGLFVWRLRLPDDSRWKAGRRAATAFHTDRRRSVYVQQPGQRLPLFTLPETQQDPAAIAGQLNVPAISRRMQLHKEQYCSCGKSFFIPPEDPSG